MSGDILSRIDATVAGRCPCGADPAPGSAWCSEDCRPTHQGPDTFGSDAMRWSAQAPPAVRGCPCGCGLATAELAGWELVEPEISDDGRTAVMRAGGGGGRPEGRTAPTRGGNGRVGYGRGAEPSLVIEDELIVLQRRVNRMVDGVSSILTGEPLAEWLARQGEGARTAPAGTAWYRRACSAGYCCEAGHVAAPGPCPWHGELVEPGAMITDGSRRRPFSEAPDDPGLPPEIQELVRQATGRELSWWQLRWLPAGHTSTAPDTSENP